MNNPCPLLPRVAPPNQLAMMSGMAHQNMNNSFNSGMVRASKESLTGPIF